MLADTKTWAQRLREKRPTSEACRRTQVAPSPLPLPERVSAVAGVSSFMKAASIAWLKEFWKLGTGTRSELSLSPSLSTVAGGTKLFSSKKYQGYNSRTTLETYTFWKGPNPSFTRRDILTFCWSSFGPHICFCFSNSQHLPKGERGKKEI